ncbi:MAG TPA: hypothetical protein PK805_03970 [Acidovorax temperans]|nr:hypothetical protein [Acidovorax temperans]
MQQLTVVNALIWTWAQVPQVQCRCACGPEPRCSANRVERC